MVAIAAGHHRNRTHTDSVSQRQHLTNTHAQSSDQPTHMYTLDRQTHTEKGSFDFLVSRRFISGQQKHSATRWQPFICRCLFCLQCGFCVRLIDFHQPSFSPWTSCVRWWPVSIHASFSPHCSLPVLHSIGRLHLKVSTRHLRQTSSHHSHSWDDPSTWLLHWRRV